MKQKLVLIINFHIFWILNDCILPSVFAICPEVCAQKPAMNYLLVVLVNSPNSLCISALKRFRLCRTILTGDQTFKNDSWLGIHTVDM